MTHSSTWFPEERGTKQEQYPLTTSRPRKSAPYTLIAILGQPWIFVDLNVTSMGKFQTTSSADSKAFLRAVWDSPVSNPFERISFTERYKMLTRGRSIYGSKSSIKKTDISLPKQQPSRDQNWRSICSIDCHLIRICRFLSAQHTEHKMRIRR